MIKKLLLPIIWIFVLSCLFSSQAVVAEEKLTIGYIGFKKDPRYSKAVLRRKLPMQPWGRPAAGAELAIKDARFSLDKAQVSLQLKQDLLGKAEDLEASVKAMLDSGVQYILLDLPADMIQRAIKAAGSSPAILFNISSLETDLREVHCSPNLLHTVPSYRQLGDALAQFLISHKWRDLLVLQGVNPVDKPWVDAFLVSAKRYGLKVKEKRDFVLGNNPRDRAKNNISLLTKGKYDVVAVLDALSEFAVQVPYQTLQPRPVVGSAGLVPEWWHWSWERHGAPQLNKRFYKLARRQMTGYDWSAWVAVKALVQGIQRTEKADFEALQKYIRAAKLEIDGFKGTRVNFRPWNGQLRQNILLAGGHWVMDRAPIEGFLHPTENLDTLGINQEESQCKAKR